jgi:hypothetical protein
MIVNPSQAQELLDILDKHFALFTAKTMGQEFLTYEEMSMLNESGFDVPNLYNQYQDHAWLNFQLGLLSDSLGQEKVSKMDYPQLKEWIAKGNYIPLTAKEQATIDSVKYQSLTDVKAHKNKIFQDVNGIIHHENLNTKASYENVIREEIVTGLENRESMKKIVSNIGHKTGDWSRDFSKSVEYISHSALNEGKSAMIQRKHGADAKIYFIVQPQACKHCNAHYLTGGEGSQPKIFNMSDVVANGSNLGKKVANWKPTVHSMHPYCRCLMQELPEGYTWDGEKFAPPDHYVSKLHRKKVKIKIGDKEIMV